jgi:hypothetical protein
VRNLVSHFEEGTQTEGFSEQSVEENLNGTTRLKASDTKSIQRLKNTQSATKVVRILSVYELTLIYYLH